MKKRKVVISSIAVVILVLAGVNFRLLHYGYIQAKGQLNIIWNSVPLETVLEDPHLPDSLKSKLKYIEQVKKFAIEDLGLKGMKNYTTFYDQEGKDLMWVVSACEPFKLESYQWGFPVLGKFSYKGFFVQEMAVTEMKKLKEKGYDVRLRTAGGWSTLGILKDPILSGMLKSDKGDLANLIIHELTHGTIFVKDSIELNENLASFIGNAGTKIFLSEEYGTDSEIVESYKQKLSDLRTFTAYVLRGAEKLDSLYQTFGDEMSFDDKNDKKQTLIRAIMQDVLDLEFYNKNYLNYFNDFKPDNTFFMSYLRYRGGQEVFEKTLQIEYQGQLKKYILVLKEKYGR